LEENPNKVDYVFMGIRFIMFEVATGGGGSLKGFKGLGILIV